MGKLGTQAKTKEFRLKGYEVLGAMEGGMSIIYKVRQEATGELRAVKTLKPEFSQDPHAVHRFHNELLTTRGLQHRNIIRTYPLDCLSTGHRYDRHFYVSEFIDGLDLQQIIEKRGPLMKADIVGIVAQTCDALHYAHTFAHNPVIHRDLKSSNILVENGTGRVVLMDFGIAQPANGQDTEFHIIGTAEYMSPEQAQGKKVDERSDLYSLGVIMYEMATGQLPFTAAQPGPNAAREILAKHLTEAPRPPREINPSVSPSLDAMILLLLEKDPLRRYQDAAVLKAHLTQQWTTETGFVPYETIQREARRRLRFPMAMLLLMAPLFVGVGVAGYLTVNAFLASIEASRCQDRAAAAYRAKQWDEAVAEFQQAQDSDPSPQRETFLRRAQGQQLLAAGLEMLDAGDIEAAIKNLDASAKRLGSRKSLMALERAKKELEHRTQMRVGDQALIEGRFDDAVNAYARAYAAKSSPDAQRRLQRARAKQQAEQAQIKADAGQWQAALEDLEKAAEIDPQAKLQRQIRRAKEMASYQSKFAKAQQAAHQGQYDQAIALLNELLALQHDPKAQRLLAQTLHDKFIARGQSLEAKGAWPQAIAAYRQAVLERDSDAAKQKLAQAQYHYLVAQADAKAKASDWGAAADLYARAIGFMDTAETRTKLKNARQQLDCARFTAMAKTSAAAGKTDLAIAQLEAAVLAKPTDAAKAELRRLKTEKWTTLARESRQRGDWQGAAQACAKLALLDPTPQRKADAESAKVEADYQTAYRMGREAADKADWDKAFDAFERACRAKKTPEAEAKRVVAGHHKYLDQGKALAAKDQWPAAAAAFKKALDFMPTEAADLALANAQTNIAYQAAFDRGEKAAAQGHWDKALIAFKEALKFKAMPEAKERIKQSKHFLLVGLGQEAERAGQWDRALDRYKEALDVWPRPEVKGAVARVRFFKLFAQAQAGAAGSARNAFAKSVEALVEEAAAPPDAVEPDAQRKDAASQFRREFLAAARLENQGQWVQALQAYRRALPLGLDPGPVQQRIDRCVKHLLKEN